MVKHKEDALEPLDELGVGSGVDGAGGDGLACRILPKEVDAKGFLLDVVGRDSAFAGDGWLDKPF